MPGKRKVTEIIFGAPLILVLRTSGSLPCARRPSSTRPVPGHRDRHHGLHHRGRRRLHRTSIWSTRRGAVLLI